MHLSAIAKILEQTQPPDLGKTEEFSLPYILTSGPFTGFEAPFASPEANAAHLHRNMIDTYLITHPHLDHISGFVINTAGLTSSRPKRLAGLPSTIAAFKTHIFNNVIWPNLSDENNGAGLVTYMRLVEGGSPAVGEGEGKGYLEITDELGVKIWAVSHGHCIERHSHRGSGSSTHCGSMDGGIPSTASTPIPMTVVASNIPSAFPVPSARGLHRGSATPNPSTVLQQQRQRDQLTLASAPQGVLAGSSAPSGPPGRRGSIAAAPPCQPHETICVYDSSAYFIRDVTTGREVLIFGDVEPDSISLSPRNQQIWAEAAPKIASGKLAAIFIECSYDDSQTVDRLFGHLAPRFIIQEMANLAEEVRSARRAQQQESGPSAPPPEKKKRKRDAEDITLITRRKAAVQARTSSLASASILDDTPISPRTVLRPPRESFSVSSESTHTQTSTSSLTTTNPNPIPPNPFTSTPHLATPTAELRLEDVDMQPVSPKSAARSPQTPFPLKGLKVVIIHVKDKMNDGPKTADVILRELREYEADTQLGCEFIISRAGECLYL